MLQSTCCVPLNCGFFRSCSLIIFSNSDTFILACYKVKGKVKVRLRVNLTVEQATKTQTVSIGIALLFL
jgi:hypothetical protein